MLLQAFRAAAGLPAALNLAPALAVPALTRGLATTATTTTTTAPKSPRKKKSLPQVLSDKVSVASKRKKPAKTKAEQKADKPKRALSAYTWFVKQNLQPTKDKPATEAFRELAARWHEISDLEKEPYVKLAEQSKAESAAARAELKAKRPPASAFAKFVQEQAPQLKERNPGASVVEKMRMASELWKQLPEAEKARRKEQYRAAKALHAAANQEAVSQQKQ